MNTRYFATMALFVLTAATAFAGAKPGFINIDLTTVENGAPADIKLRLPLSLAGVLAPQIQGAMAEVRTAQGDVNLRDMWAQIKNAGPMRLVDVSGPDANVTVDTTDDHLVVRVDSADEGRVHIQVPLALGAVFFENDTVDVPAMLSALEALSGQDLLTIEGDRVNGRIWID